MPFEIPDSWEWVRLSDIADVGTGATPKTNIKEYYNGDIPWITSSSTQWEIIDKPVSLISKKAVDETNCKIYKAGTIIIAMYGEGKTRGQVSELAIDSATNQACAAISLFNVELKDYVKAFLKYSYGGIRYLSVGGVQPNLNLKVIEQFKIPLPPHSEQLRIVTEIKRWFALIEDLEENKGALLEAIKQAKSKILSFAISGKLVAQDPNDEPAIELLKRINPNFIPCDTSYYPQLPKGWVVCRLEDIVDYEQPAKYIVESTEYSDEFETPVLTAGKSFILGYTNETNGIYKNLPTIIFDDFTTDSRLVDFPFKVKSSAMKILQVHKEINIEYIAYFMSITRLTGDTHKRYWISEYSKIHIPLPPINEQNRIVSAIRDIEDKLQVIIDEL